MVTSVVKNLKNETLQSNFLKQIYLEITLGNRVLIKFAT